MVVAGGMVTGATSLPFTITAAPVALGITTQTPLPDATLGVAYSQTIQATGGTTPYTWSEVVGAGGTMLPPGLTLTQAPAPNSNDALISGTPTAAGNFSFTVQVTDSAASQATDNRTFSLDVNNPTPSITTLTPSSATEADPNLSPSFTLTVDGAGFLSASEVRWNGNPRATTFVSATQLTASIPDTDIAARGTAQVEVFNPVPGGGASNALPFTINPPAGLPPPAITSISPGSAFAGGATFPLTVNGTDFDATSQVNWGGSPRTTTFVSATQVTATIPATDLNVATPPAVVVQITVVNSLPGGGNATSNAVPFTINALPPPTPAGVLERISVDTAGNGSATGQSPPAGTEGNPLSMSADGRFVVFQSSAVLDAGDTNGFDDVYLRDTCRGPSAPMPCNKSTERILGVAVPEIPTGSPAISADGQWIAFIATDPSGADATLLVRRTSGGTPLALASSSNFEGLNAPVLSRDGRFVAFVSGAGLVLPNNGKENVFLLDRDADGNGAFDEPGPGTQLIQASLTPSGGLPDFFSLSPAISADGRFVAFVSSATDLLPPGQDTNNSDDIFLFDRVNAAVSRVSVDSSGAQAVNSALPFALFHRNPAISGDGRFIAFVSSADNLIPAGQDTNGAEDVFLRDTCFGAPAGCTTSTIRVSISNTGAQAVGSSGFPALSFTGRFIAFASTDENLVASDMNLSSDTFVHDTCFGAPVGCTFKTVIVSAPPAGSNGGSQLTEISEDGSLVVFSSSARGLVPGDSGLSNFDTFLAATGLNVNLPSPPPPAPSAKVVPPPSRRMP